MNTFLIKTLAVASIVLLSSNSFAQSLNCNADARILASNGNGSQGSFNASTNGNSTNANGGTNDSVEGELASETQAVVQISDNLDRQSCFGSVTARLTNPNTGALYQSVVAELDGQRCKVTLQGQVNLSQEQPISNGNCFVENRGNQVTIAGVTYAISGFSSRNVQ